MTWNPFGNASHDRALRKGLAGALPRLEATVQKHSFVSHLFGKEEDPRTTHEQSHPGRTRLARPAFDAPGGSATIAGNDAVEPCAPPPPSTPIRLRPGGRHSVPVEAIGAARISQADDILPQGCEGRCGQDFRRGPTAKIAARRRASARPRRNVPTARLSFRRDPRRPKETAGGPRSFHPSASLHGRPCRSPLFLPDAPTVEPAGSGMERGRIGLFRAARGSVSGGGAPISKNTGR